MEDILPGYGIGFLVISAVVIFTFGIFAVAIIGSIIGWILKLFK